VFLSCTGDRSSNTTASPNGTTTDPDIAELTADGVLSVPAEFATIQKGLDAARSGDTVLVASGTYYENIVWPDVDGIVLVSESGADMTIIDGQQRDSVISIEYSSVTTATRIEGFTITNGLSGVHLQCRGGGITISGANPTISGNIVTDNAALECGAGGIEVARSSEPVISGNTISNNSASWTGGGVECRNNSHALITDNIIMNNSADGCGGGIFTSDDSIPVDFLSGNNDVHSNIDGTCVVYPDCDDICILGQLS